MKRALVLSLLAHALFVAWVLTRPPRVLPQQEKPIQVDIIAIPIPAAPAPEPKEPKPEPPAPPEPPKVVHRAPVAPVVQPLPEPEAPTPPPAPQPQARIADAPRLEPTLVPGIGSGGNGLLLPQAMLMLDAGYVDDEHRGLHAPEVAQDIVAAAAKETIGRGRVARGMVHPYYVTLGKALIKNWDADRAVSSAGLKGYVEQMGENTRTWNNIWKERAAAFGKGGSPIEDNPDLPMRPINDRIVPYGGNGVDQTAKRELQRQMNSAFKATRRATIRVVQNKAGKLTKVELVEPSNDEHVDREAVEDVRAAALNMPPPPAEALGDKDELSSLWSFELVVSITPPVPTFTFEFDEALGFIDARLPLDRRIYKKVKLVAVE